MTLTKCFSSCWKRAGERGLVTHRMAPEELEGGLLGSAQFPIALNLSIYQRMMLFNA
jgi:hypothetical protein